jgi:hypothetical protein
MMRPDDLFALTWALYRLQLSTAQTTAVWWWAVVRMLWLPQGAVRRPGPSLAQMVRETRQDTFESDEGGSA